jgi:RecA-family ATPase
VTEKFKLYSLSELQSLPPVEWLIDGVLPVDAPAILFGYSGEGKSWVAQDMAACIAHGKEWVGRKVRQGPVVYVCAEGFRGQIGRARAWHKYHGVEEGESLFYVRDTPQLTRDLYTVADKIAGRNLKPALTIFDTFARCSEGVDENSAKEVGQVLARMTDFQKLVGGATMLVHHTGKNKEDERGSTALRAAMEASLRVSQDASDVISVQSKKQKDAEDFEELRFRLHRYEYHHAGVLVPSAVLLATTEQPKQAGLGHLAYALRALATFGKREVTKEEWRVAAGSPNHNTFYAHLRQLKERGYVDSHGRDAYTITDAGTVAVGEL